MNEQLLTELLWVSDGRLYSNIVTAHAEAKRLRATGVSVLVAPKMTISPTISNYKIYMKERKLCYSN